MPDLTESQLAAMQAELERELAAKDAHSDGDDPRPLKEINDNIRTLEDAIAAAQG